MGYPYQVSHRGRHILSPSFLIIIIIIIIFVYNLYYYYYYYFLFYFFFFFGGVGVISTKGNHRLINTTALLGGHTIIITTALTGTSSTHGSRATNMRKKSCPRCPFKDVSKDVNSNCRSLIWQCLRVKCLQKYTTVPLLWCILMLWLNILLIADVVSKIISLVIFVCLAMWSIRNLLTVVIITRRSVADSARNVVNF